MTVDTKTGRVSLSEDEYVSLSESNVGVCIKCGAEASDVEPDARRYKCVVCDKLGVYGLEELMVMNRIEFE